jgi:hypothetical protein
VFRLIKMHRECATAMPELKIYIVSHFFCNHADIIICVCPSGISQSAWVRGKSRQHWRQVALLS